MIALMLFINLLSHINCQQMQSWASYSQPTAFVYQEPSIGSDNSLWLQNQQNYQVYQGFNSQSPYPLSQLTPRTNVPSISTSSPSQNSPFTFGESSSPLKRVTGSQMSITPNLCQKMSEILSTIPKTTPSIPTAPALFEPIQYSFPTNQFPVTSQKPTQTQFSSSTPTFSSFTNSSPSPITSASPSKPPRSIIPSPLTETLQYPNADLFTNVFELPEPTLGPVGCLALTMTPYGTISETPLPDPSTTLPRSPHLPVSSPVSALAPPLSPHLPPASPASRGSHFLRKVPVPPPFI